MAGSVHQGEEEVEIERIFKSFDANGDGKISRDELKEALSCATRKDYPEEQLHSMMAELDADGDGHISFDEFATFYRANRRFMKELLKNI